MDQIGLQQQKAMAEQKNYQTLKKVTKLLFSLSLFSFFFALPSWFPFHLFHSSNLYSPTLRFHLFDQPIDKNCMFLLCNGLLVFLAKYSGLFKSLSSSRRNYDSLRVYEFGPLSDPMMLEVEKPLVVRETTEVATTQERESRYAAQQERKDESEESGHLTSSEGEMEERIISVPESGDVSEDNYGLGTSFFAMERVEDDDTTTNEEENDGVLSDEELNRKFDEFIKRMKEEIIVDARRTLVVV